MKRNNSSSLQSFMCCLLEEHSATSYDIQIDNAKRPMSARSNSVSSIQTEPTSDGSGHSRGSIGQSSRRQDSETYRGRPRKSRWDADCEKTLVTPRRCSSPMNLSKMMPYMDLTGSGSEGATLRLPSTPSDESKSDESVHELLDDVLAILR